MKVKTFGATRVKAMDDAGKGTAVIATLNVIDKDGDVTMPGAFGDQHAVVVPTHNWNHVPLGKATIREEGNEVLADFQLNLDIQAAREWHSALKFDLANGDALQEWSYGFTIKDSSIGDFDGESVRFLKSVDVHEISPVLLGAGEGTRTLAVKSAKAAPVHEAKTSMDVWDGPANERRLPTKMDRNTASAAYALIPDGDEIAKGDAMLMHHFVDDDGRPGPASVKAAIMGIATLNGARGGARLSEAERKAAYEHLAGHLKDAGEEVPELRDYDELSMKLSDQIRFAVWDAEAAVERAKGVAEMRKKEGRKFSEERIADLAELSKAVSDLNEAVAQIKGAEVADVNKLLGDYHATIAKIKGLM